MSLPKFGDFKIFISTKCSKSLKQKIQCFQWHTWIWSWLNLSKLGYFKIENEKLNVFNDIVGNDHDWVFQNSEILKYSFQQSVFNDTLEEDHAWNFQS